MLARGELQTIGATTLDEYRKHLEKMPRSSVVSNQFKLLNRLLAIRSKFLKDFATVTKPITTVSISDSALVSAATLADRYISDRFLPDKAIDLIDEAGSRLRIRRMTAPPELREFDEKIANARRDKESAIDAQDFEKAASLRDKEKTSYRRKSRARKDLESWRSRYRCRS